MTPVFDVWFDLAVIRRLVKHRKEVSKGSLYDRAVTESCLSFRLERDSERKNLPMTVIEIPDDQAAKLKASALKPSLGKLAEEQMERQPRPKKSGYGLLANGLAGIESRRVQMLTPEPDFLSAPRLGRTVPTYMDQTDNWIR